MILVEQRQLWRPDDHPEGPQYGDCYRACVASIFEVAYEETDGITGGDSQTLTDWVRRRYPGVGMSYRMLGDTWKDVETLDSWRQWPESHYEPGYWIATVKSKRIPDREIYGCGCGERTPGGDPDCRWCGGKPDTRFMGIQWGLHAVVMRHGVCVWDPHPERDKGFGPFCGATFFRVEDPAKLLVDIDRAEAA